MKILLTGANGYIGRRLLPNLLELGHEVYCAVRDAKRFTTPYDKHPAVQVLELDFSKPETLRDIPSDIQFAYYLIHSMSSSYDYSVVETACAINFREAMDQINLEQCIYLSGMSNSEQLSKHLKSRLSVEQELSKGHFALTTLRAGIIIGSGSASFEIIRDLVEKLPIMVAPKWLNTRCQPIAIRNVLEIMTRALGQEDLYNNNYDIGGHDILTYREMLLQFAAERKLKRVILTVPVMTPRLSSYWLYFITSTSYKLAVALVNSMKVEVICRDDFLNQRLEIDVLSYREAIRKAFVKIKQDSIVSSWKDSMVSGRFKSNFSRYMEVPSNGCFKDERSAGCPRPEQTLQMIWSIGGQNKWYYGSWLWEIRGFLDKVMGGVGLRRGRTRKYDIKAGDALDFWRVLYANREEGRLLLFAEMRLPGEAWLEFRMDEDKVLHQTATFRPLGLFGRLYWYVLVPFHEFIFEGMLQKLCHPKLKEKKQT